jgi:hypothetical protein
MKLSKRAGEVIPFPTREPEETVQHEPAEILQLKPKGFMDLTVDHLTSLIEKYKNKEIDAIEFTNRLTYLAAETQEEMFEEQI